MKNLEICRTKINELDNKIIELLKERFVVVKEVKDYKHFNNLPVYDKAREDSHIKELQKLSDDLLKKDMIEEIFLKIMDQI